MSFPPVLLSLVLAVLTAACTSSSPTPTTESTRPGPLSQEKPTDRAVAGEITVFAASSLTDAFQATGERFRAANPSASVVFNFASSTQLVTQLDQGARADVFASADQIQMDRARALKRIAGIDRIFATNRLVVIVPATNRAGLRGAGDLGREGLKIVASDPVVPVGVYTQKMLDAMSERPQLGSNFKDQVNANVVSREANVRQIVAKVALDEADAGVVYKTDVTPKVAPQLKLFSIPDQFNTIATYPIARVGEAPNETGADAFITYVLSPAGQEILTKWDFGHP